MLVFEGTLVMVLKFGSNARNELSYNGQPSKLVHLPDDSDSVEADDGEKNDFAFSIKAGLSSVLMFMYVSLLGLYSGFKSLVPFVRFCVRIKLILPSTIA